MNSFPHKLQLSAQATEVDVADFCNKRSTRPRCGRFVISDLAGQHGYNTQVSRRHMMQSLFSVRRPCGAGVRRGGRQGKKKRRKCTVESLTPLTGAESNPSSIRHAWVNLIGSAYCYHFLRFIHRARGNN